MSPQSLIAISLPLGGLTMGRVVPLVEGKFPTRDAVVFSVIILSNWRADVWDSQERLLEEHPQNPLQLAKFHFNTGHLMVTRWLLCIFVSYHLQADYKSTNGQRNISSTKLGLFIHKYVPF